MQPIWKNARNLRKNATDAEQKLWRHLRNRQLAGVKFRTQYPIAGHVADFASPEQRLVIELDGGQHADRQDQDEERTRKLNCNGYRVLRFWNDDVLLRTEDVVTEILRVLTQPLPSPPLQSQGRE